MLRVELACQEFDRNTGPDGKTSWRVEVDEEQLLEVMSIRNVFVPNTRKADQLDGVAIWAIRDPLMLVTVLKSWGRRKEWVTSLLDCLSSDPRLERSWELRTLQTEDVDAIVNDPNELALNLIGDAIEDVEFLDEETELEWIVDDDDYVPESSELPDKEEHRARMKARLIVRRMFDRIHSEPLPEGSDQDLDEFLLSEEEEKLVLDRYNLDFQEDEVDHFVSNLGQEDQLW